MGLKYSGILLFLCFGLSNCSTSIQPADVMNNDHKDMDKVHKETMLETASSTVIVSPTPTQHSILAYANHYPYPRAIRQNQIAATSVGHGLLKIPTVAYQIPQPKQILVPGVAVAPAPVSTFTFPTYHLGYHSFFGRNYNYANFGYSGIYSGNGLPLYNGFRPLGLYTKIHTGGNLL